MTMSRNAWHLFGLAALASGIISLTWHDYKAPVAFFAAAAVAQIVGGAAMQFSRTTKAGAVVLGAVYLMFAFLCVPRIIGAPQIYNNWGNFFEPFSLAIGAGIVYSRLSSAWTPETQRRIGRILFGLCAASFALEQAFYLGDTAPLVPKWLPPGQMFWAVATTIAFALAAVALMTNRMAALAARLLTLMIAIFGLVVWVPLIVANPRSHTNWSEGVLTFAIAAAAWILADLLAEADAKVFIAVESEPQRG